MCIRDSNYVQEYWKEEIKQLKAKIKTVTQQEAQELERKLKWMQETEMAVVISQEPVSYTHLYAGAWFDFSALCV